MKDTPIMRLLKEVFVEELNKMLSSQYAPKSPKKHMSAATKAKLSRTQKAAWKKRKAQKTA